MSHGSKKAARKGFMDDQAKPPVLSETQQDPSGWTQSYKKQTTSSQTFEGENIYFVEPRELCFILIINLFQIWEFAESVRTAACWFKVLWHRWAPSVAEKVWSQLMHTSVALSVSMYWFKFLNSLRFVLFFRPSGVGSLQRTSSQRSAMTYQRNNYALNTAANYADPYRSAQYRPSDPNYAQAVVVDDGATRSPSIDSIQKDPR